MTHHVWEVSFTFSFVNWFSYSGLYRKLSIGLKNMAKNYSSLFLASEQELPDCPTREAPSLSIFIGLPQPTHNEVSVVPQHKREKWLVIHLSHDHQEQSGEILYFATPRMDLFQRLSRTWKNWQKIVTSQQYNSQCIFMISFLGGFCGCFVCLFLDQPRKEFTSPL